MNTSLTPVLTQLDDDTGLSLFQYCKMAPGKLFCDVVAVKASFALTPEGIDPQPMPGMISMADEPHDAQDPLGSSLARAGDLILGKPGCDLYVTGSVRNAYCVGYWNVGISAGDTRTPVMDYRCTATGPRHWQYSLFSGWHLSEIEDTQEVPIRYELAWGGREPEVGKPAHLWKTHKPNPSGSGFSFEGYSRDARIPAYQWQPHSTFFAPGPAQLKQLTGLGPVARFWASRQCYAGTHDDDWLRANADTPIKDYPKDFDLRYFQAAHPCLQAAKPFRGDEALRLSGLLPVPQTIHTRLPGWSIVVAGSENYSQQDQKQKLRLPLDTIHIELDAEQSLAHLVWRLTLPHTLGVQHVHLQREKL
jgi:hypothetical protein